MIIGLFILCLTIGLGLIWHFFGANAALPGLFCLAGAVVVVLVIVLLLNIIERIAKNE
jgi:membrane protein YdbS with pleckstrin-like domain